MKKYFVLLLLFFFVKNNYAQSWKKLAGDTIIWSANYQLLKEDFKGKPKGKNAGLTEAVIYFYPKENSGTMKFVVEAIFVKSKSFLRGDSKYVMQHEQLHFDITEVNARRLRKRIMEKDFTKVKNISEVIQSFFNKTNAEWNHEQMMYDKDTEHGMNPAKQDIWNAKVAAELKELDAFATTEIDIRK